MSTSEPTLIQNALRTIEDDHFIVSSHVHDYRSHTLPDGSTIAVDGGRGPGSYARRVGSLVSIAGQSRYEEYCLSDADPFPWIADRLLWGTRGVDGQSPLTFRPIKTFTTDHLLAIRANCSNAGEWHRKVVQYWIDQRLGSTSTPDAAPAPTPPSP